MGIRKLLLKSDRKDLAAMRNSERSSGVLLHGSLLPKTGNIASSSDGISPNDYHLYVAFDDRTIGALVSR